ncbi:MAG: DUF2796 domain-containing protein [Gammaproteobacteria bacterium]|nr:DUF2796 domain-containing protein [Gammaproteobacteria bacterium]MBT3722136.1 DUF2796 domain-containing protein [Gammaproteobacteria bacterium]MBT4448887.1 DUF2796 domain-containing protein [Gammaproteobacteria bacterium]MBT4863117.1 DUF2796 domain-containing protein [Gammaproteobacteria bacterium]MBT6455700.1 DUF2796 domain-containing protein [Gammaproteobacteria bacterium]
MDAAVQQLQNLARLIRPEAAAQCTQEHIALHSELLEEEHHKKEHQHDEEEATGHSDFEVHVHFHCQKPGKLTGIDTAGLFKAFLSMEELEVQWISDQKQSSVELSPKNTRINLQ